MWVGLFESSPELDDPIWLAFIGLGILLAMLTLFGSAYVALTRPGALHRSWVLMVGSVSVATCFSGAWIRDRTRHVGWLGFVIVGVALLVVVSFARYQRRKFATGTSTGRESRP
jgi:hypothetical protein